MSDNNEAKKLMIGLAIKVLIVVGIGTATAFWFLSTL